MKKIFTLLFAVGMFALAQAQPGTRDNRRNDQRNNQQNDQRDFNDGYENGKVVIDADFSFGNDRGYGNSRFSNERKRDMQIARINRMFDHKIHQVRNSYFMSRWEKQRQIRSLEHQRHMEIRTVYAKFSNRNRYDDRNRGYDNNRGYERNNNSGRQY